jgi:GT2 family glycosyltransferase
MRFAPSGRVAIVVPVHNRLALTNALVSELRRSEHDEALVVIVDDGSTDGTSDYLREHHPDVVVASASGDLWWSGAANLGCLLAIERDAEFLLLFNNDNFAISPNCVSELVRCVREFGGCASSVVLHRDSQRLQHAGGLLDWPSRGIRWRETGAIYRQEARVADCEWLPGMALAFSAGLFRQLDGFNAAVFPQHYADADFTLRARALGKRCVVSYSCWVRNDERTSGVNFYSLVSPMSFVYGLFSLRSSYQLRSTFRFARRYCPQRFIPQYLTLFYLRYAYATIKTWLPARFRVALSR